MVVGGGPAGISTWLHLQKYAPDIASRCILIEKEKYPREKLCGGAVGGWSENILKHLGIDINIPSMWVDTVECLFGDDIYRLHEPRYFRMIQRTDFDHTLAKLAIRRGLRLHENEMFLDFVRKNDCLEVKTNLNRYKIKTIVGADGALSKVRQKMRLPNKPNLAPTIEIFSPVDPRVDPEFEERKVVLDFSPTRHGLQGYIWHFPTLRNGQPFMNHGIVDFRIYKNRERTDMKSMFLRELEKRNIHSEIKACSGHPIRWLSNDDVLVQPNILLAGDAAGIEPATGGGIHLALSYGEVAANTIINGFAMNDFSFNDYANKLKNHLTGRFINKLSSLALAMYGQRMNPIDAMKEIFTKRDQGQHN
jgi:flavin-dependent dehydrogenase